MPVTRTRGMLACAYCRRRKRRCDGVTPKCGTCAEKGLICNYTKPDSSSVPRDQTLARIASLLESHPDILSRSPEPHHGDRVVERQAISVLESPRPHPNPTFDNASIPSATWLFNSPVNVDDGASLPPLTIPLGHQTSTSSLLMLPLVQALVGVYPEDFFFRVESKRHVVPSIALPGVPDDDCVETPPLDSDTTRALVDRFFETDHSINPFLDKKAFLARYNHVCNGHANMNDESAVVLAVLAIGAIDGKTRKNNEESVEDAPGMQFFKPALRILSTSWMTCFTGDIILCQGLVLCALYFQYLVQPLPAWRLIHMASTNVQQLLIRSKKSISNSTEIEEITRLSWSCFLIECDIVSEFHQPRSGIEPLVDKMPYPRSGDLPSPSNLAFMAEISVRFLINRVQHSIYFTDGVTIYSGRLLDSFSSNLFNQNMSDESLLSVCKELDHQLETWYQSLPEIIKPALSSDLDCKSQAKVLRLRYWSAKQIIYRPFLIYATSLSSDQKLPTFILDKCQICFSSCRMSLKFSREWLTSLWLQLTLWSCFMSAVLLSLAATCPQLSGYVPDIDDLLDTTAMILKPWAAPATGIECALDILISIQKKIRYRD
ncbi:hypothetical protein CNMCM5793_006449 [Aspergillus hiratsukae]|uniref:Zn(2)-C6 fungal-type domain-containing protein n=1 Tax=Aspergillus hiratsukae TaxID=1194566 RepID=A0A8H6UNZ4_9EURO|nr:hypothetical protein CNMCM5793_006449 [Aspergillus hiratsukae]KAF7160240.1 hypothetical protein CNMCM6106_007676 [Aspergillus hiratsukae]